MRPRWPFVVSPLLLLGLIAAPIVWRVGEAREGRRLLATGQTLALDPNAVALPARGLDMALSPDGTTTYAKTTRGVVKIDLESDKVVAEARSRVGRRCAASASAR